MAKRLPVDPDGLTRAVARFRDAGYYLDVFDLSEREGYWLARVWRVVDWEAWEFDGITLATGPTRDDALVAAIGEGLGVLLFGRPRR